jgi:hypothetical protein
MTKYIVVANQTAISDELTTALLDLSKHDHSAEFVLVVPATPVELLFKREEGSARETAARRAGRALTHLTEAGVHVVGAHVGAASPIGAVDDAIRDRISEYSGIIVSTFAPAESRWLAADLPRELGAAFHLPVTHVVAQR